jgi:hypothetical protein
MSCCESLCGLLPSEIPVGSRETKQHQGHRLANGYNFGVAGADAGSLAEVSSLPLRPVTITEAVLLMQPTTMSGRKWRHSVCTKCCVTVSNNLAIRFCFISAKCPVGYEIFAPDGSYTDRGIIMFMSELTTLIEPFIVAITILLGAFTIAGCMQK